MRWLSARGYTTLTLDALRRCRAGMQPWPPRPVVITIDDGYAEAVRYALEVLPPHGFTATVFLVAGAMGGSSSWDPGVAIPVAGWDSAREMLRAGFTCGSHSMTHARLDTLPPDACAREVRESRLRLEDGLGVAVTHFAYPYGAVNASVRRLVAESGYATACGARLDLASDRDDELVLPRVLVVRGDSFADFVCRLRTARTVDVMVRARLQRWGRSFLAGSPEAPDIDRDGKAP
jgi:peptidoglycan/xylan/chitin deacetylase (PgdA/CDA1 family)